MKPWKVEPGTKTCGPLDPYPNGVHQWRPHTHTLLPWKRQTVLAVARSQAGAELLQWQQLQLVDPQLVLLCNMTIEASKTRGLPPLFLAFLEGLPSNINETQNTCIGFP